MVFEFKIPISIEIEELTKNEIEKSDSQLMTREYGSPWAKSERSAILKVSSFVIRSENNDIINTMLSDFKKLKIANTTPFYFDA